MANLDALGIEAPLASVPGPIGGAEAGEGAVVLLAGAATLAGLLGTGPEPR